MHPELAALHTALEPLADPVTPSPAVVPARARTGESWRPRLDAVDFLRGLVMAIMVLDHTRDFLGGSALNPRDVHDPVLFLTRWITHFCAPVFVFLSGMSAFLYGNRGRTRGELGLYLVTRGLFLVAMEFTVVRLGWTFNLAYDFLLLQVIWAIGVSMIALSAFVHLPRAAIAVIGMVLVFGHNLLDGIKASSFGDAGWLWMVLHEPGMLHPAEGVTVFALYPLIPWIGVMALGYALAPILLLEDRRRGRILAAVGLLVIAAFVLLRASHLYGDPGPWTPQDGALATVLAFINCEKYPPSLLYLCMTIGPALLVLALFDGEARRWWTRSLVTIGRVPFLLYVAHIFVLHALAVAVAAASGFDTAWLFTGLAMMSKPTGYGLELPAVYAAWILVVLALYPFCRWFAEVKQRRKDWWLSYL
jgi:uncharacterized membrane protein